MTVPAAFDLTGRVALVTGGGSPEGIGFATARLLGQLGAAVAVAATTERAHERARELDKSGVASLGVVADLTDEAEVRRAVADVAAVLGAPSVLVNNAGMTSLSAPTLFRDLPAGAESGPESGTIADLTPEQWRRSLSRNLDTAFLTTRAVLAGLHSRGVVRDRSVPGGRWRQPGGRGARVKAGRAP